MRKFLLLVAGALLLAGASVAWSAAGGDGPQQDRLAGGGAFGPGCSDGPVPFCPPRGREFSIDAASNPEGGGAYGTFSYGATGTGVTLVSGRVTCLHVEDGSAVAGGYIVGSNPLGVFFVYMQDRGTAGSFDHDRSSAAFVDPASAAPPGFPNECSPLDNGAFNTGHFDLTAGDVQITDAK
jgi:hypothetical protein